jgi:hypothetical protein
MSEADYVAFKGDIAVNGLREPIWVYKGEIIDGRNRFRACRELAIKPKFREWDGNGSLVDFVVSVNLHRRHLTPSQRAIVALEIEPLLAQEARKRRGVRSDLVEKIPRSDFGKARDLAAKITGVNPHYVSDVKNIARQMPTLTERIKTGGMTITEAKRKLREDAREQRREENRRLVARFDVADG